MRTKLRFYREYDGKWYADIPSHSKEDNEMILGSDSLLDTLSEGESSVTLDISDSSYTGYQIKLSMVSHDEDGAEYIISGPLRDIYSSTDSTLWICNVTHTVFGEHPDEIYLSQILY